MCDKCDWEGSIEMIDDMLDDEDFEWASDTLTGIKQWINDNQHVTEAQDRALANIRARGD